MAQTGLTSVVGVSPSWAKRPSALIGSVVAMPPEDSAIWQGATPNKLWGEESENWKSSKMDYNVGRTILENERVRREEIKATRLGWLDFSRESESGGVVD